MRNQTGIIVLTVICIGLIGVLIWNVKRSSDQKGELVSSLGSFSNKAVTASVALEDERKVRAELESDRLKQSEAFYYLSNAYTEVSANLEKTSVTLRSTREELVQRDNKIADLESQNQMLDQRALELSLSITNLTEQIADTRRKLAASEGDKEVLARELTRMMNEKAELERKFNDLSTVRAQVAKLKEELGVSRRLDWMRRGLSSDQKGGEQLMQKSLMSGPASTPPPKQPAYDLNVEVGTDGSIRVIPPLTNQPPAGAPSR